MSRILATVTCALLLAGCGPSTGGSPTGELTDGLALGTSPFVVVDLAAHTVEQRVAIPDLASNPDYRDRLLVFRRVGSGSSQAVIAVFELTQAQWGRIDGGSTPWTLIDVRVVAASGYSVSTKPAYNITYDDAAAALAAFVFADGTRLAIPTSAQWATACGIGSGWTWGEALDRTTLQANAVVREGVLDQARLLGGVDVGGPLPVGTRATSPTGIYDLHGNVWEWTTSASGPEVRGGSWRDSVWSARAEIAATRNGSGVHQALDHALIGVRPILVPR